MLYDGSFRFMREAAAAMDAGNRSHAGDRIGRAHAVLEELLVTLNPEPAPELYQSLASLYRFCMGHLVEANVHQDSKRIAEVITLLTPIRDAWKQAIQQTGTP